MTLPTAFCIRSICCSTVVQSFPMLAVSQQLIARTCCSSGFSLPISNFTHTTQNPLQIFSLSHYLACRLTTKGRDNLDQTLLAHFPPLLLLVFLLSQLPQLLCSAKCHQILCQFGCAETKDHILKAKHPITATWQATSGGYVYFWQRRSS